MAENNSNVNDTGAKNPAFDIIRLYVKDLSLETPNTPDIFRKESNYGTEVQLNCTYRKGGLLVIVKTAQKVATVLFDNHKGRVYNSIIN